jgi:ethanolamine utilization protein EutQ (cupin superfamily)
MSAELPVLIDSATATEVAVGPNGDEISCGAEQTIAEPGQAVFFPGGATYYIKTLGSDAVQLVWTGFPAS